MTIHEQHQLTKWNSITLKSIQTIDIIYDPHSLSIWNYKTSIIITDRDHNAFEYSFADLKQTKYNISLTQFIMFQKNIIICSPSIAFMSKIAFAKVLPLQFQLSRMRIAKVTEKNLSLS